MKVVPYITILQLNTVGPFQGQYSLVILSTAHISNGSDSEPMVLMAAIDQITDIPK